MRKIQMRSIGILVLMLLVCGTAYAFPLDPNPSTIPNNPAAEGGFPGDWTNTLRGYGSINAIRVTSFMDWEFKTQGGGPGGPTDLDIWYTPSFTTDKVSQDRSSWARLVAYPTQTVNEIYGKSIFTSHKEMIDFIESLPKDYMTVEYLGEIPRGFPWPFVIFSKEPKPHTPEQLAKSGKPLVWVQGLIHGGEWSAGESPLATAYDLAYERPNAILKDGPNAGKPLLDLINVIILPRICADGAKAPRRETNDLVALQWTPTPELRDLNRDNMLFDLPVSRVVRKLNVAYQPHISVNLHERGNSTFTTNVENTFGMRIDNDAHDIGASAANHLVLPRDFLSLYYNYIVPDLQAFAPKYSIHFGMYREGTDTYGHGINTNFAAGGIYADADYRSSFINSKAWDPDAPYFLISEAAFNTRNARNHNAMAGCISLLFENKSGPTNVGNRGMWERRVATGYLCTLSAMITAANRPEFIGTLNQMRKDWVEKGKKVTSDDMIPIHSIPPKPTYVDREWNVIDVDRNYTVQGFSAANPVEDLNNIVRYDWTKSLKKNPNGTGSILSGDYDPVKDNSGSRDRQPFKLELVWQGFAIKERIRPYAYIFDGPYANELATRMLLSGINVKRLASDVTIDVEGWHYNARTVFNSSNDDRGVGPYVDLANSGSNGWLNRDVTIFNIPNRTFKKDNAYVVYLGQLRVHVIPMYMEPDFPWNAASCIFLPYMSVALGGASTRSLSPALVGVEMPAYRYLKEVDLPTYDVDHFLPLINRGAVPRFFSYHTQDSLKNIANGLGLNPSQTIKVFDYDIQVHTRTDALQSGKFDMTLPTSENTSSYLIQKKDGSYVPLVPHSMTLDSNVATISVADHGRVPWTVDVDSSGRPVIGDGSYRTVPKALPANDDLYGFRIIEVQGDDDDDDGCKHSFREWWEEYGCNAGIPLLAVLALAGFMLRRKF
ncbi:MAG: hypothetical protein FWF87_03070 [Synergistaceae bacterium]|nr:hypothetical protein [Synergistaceae bacterium]